MKKYLIVIEETGSGYTAYSPDLPDCVVSGRTRAEVEHKIRHSVALHLQDLRQCGEVLPEPRSFPSYIELP
jgi:predicted RNase H-like HicB family nuclease